MDLQNIFCQNWKMTVIWPLPGRHRILANYPKSNFLGQKFYLIWSFFIPYELELRCMGKNHAKFGKKNSSKFQICVTGHFKMSKISKFSIFKKFMQAIFTQISGFLTYYVITSVQRLQKKYFQKFRRSLEPGDEAEKCIFCQNGPILTAILARL